MHVHTLTVEAVTQRSPLLIRSNFGLSVTLKDTSTCSWGEPGIRTGGLTITGRQTEPTGLQPPRKLQPLQLQLVGHSISWLFSWLCIFRGTIHESQRKKNAGSLRWPVSVSENFLIQIEIKIWIKRIPVSPDIGLVLIELKGNCWGVHCNVPFFQFLPGLIVRS